MKTEDLSEIYKKIYQQNAENPFIKMPASAIGLLRKELIDTIGIERTKGFLLRYGWNSGVSDALNIIKVFGRESKESLLVGPRVQSLHGYLKNEVVDIFEVDFKKKTIYLEGVWINSYEAREHLKLFGLSDHSVCHTLTGYASGYLSTILGEKVIAKEIECTAMGHEHCRAICRTEREWGESIKPELHYYETNSMIKELNKTYEQLKHERDNLQKSHYVHEKLVNELLQDNGLSSLVKLTYEVMRLPIYIVDMDQNIIAFEGISEEELHVRMSPSMKNGSKTEYIQKENEECELCTPIYFKQKIVGYYSFIYRDRKPQDIDKMIIERASLACSISLLNERIRFQSEQRLKGSFLEEILSGTLNQGEIIKRAYYLGVKLNPPFYILTITTTPKPSYLENLEFNEELINDLNRYFKDQNVNAVLGQKNTNIHILFHDNHLVNNKKDKKLFCERVFNYISLKYPKEEFKFGSSSTNHSIVDIAQIYEESLVSLKITNAIRNIVLYDELGIEGILLQSNISENFQKLIQEKMGSLMDEDKQKNGELIKTLYQYLNSGCNVLKTARKMNFSVSGLRYRLDRINNLLEMDIKKPSNTYQLYMALKFMALSGEIDIDLEDELKGEE